MGLSKCEMRVQEKAHQNEDEFKRRPGSEEEVFAKLSACREKILQQKEQRVESFN